MEGGFTMGHKYSVILCTLASSGGNVWEKPREVLEAVAQAGYDGVDLDAEPDRIDARQFDEVKDLATSLGLQVPALIGAWAPWHAGEVRDLASSDESERRHGVDYAKKSVDLATTFDEPPVFEIVASPAQSEYPVAKTPRNVLRANFIKSTREITEYAAERNVEIAIEPINRFEGYPGFLNAVDDAMIVIDEIAAGNLGVLLDFFHANIEDVSIPGAIRMAGSKLMNIHLSDSNRDAPGTGHIDFIDAIKALAEVGYEGYISMGFLPSRLDLDKLREAFLEKSVGYMKEQERAALSG
jgi:sugar phosphate isomerase/epimerase